MEKQTLPSRAVTAAVIVAALGYFVDIYDLILFGIVRNPSLKDLGITGTALTELGGLLISIQMIGMLIGGILWGVLGDKKGRLSVLFGSILMYSVANIANAYVDTVEWYGFWRFIAGIGLAGELGAGITLVSELMHRERRGYGTTIVATVGLIGAVVAYAVSAEFGWRNAYIVGGCMGLALLVLRITVYESGMFSAVKEKPVQRGNFFSLFTNWERFVRYLRCVLIGVPLWFVVGILVINANEFAGSFGIKPLPEAGKAVMFCYIGLAIGDIACGLISQMLASRKKAVFIFLCLEVATIAFYLSGLVSSADMFYATCGLLGVASGYWAVFVTIASEQFGTNIRATVTTTVPNFVRGTLSPLTALFLALYKPWGVTLTGALMGAAVVGIAFVALGGMKETFGKDLDYLEGMG